MVPSFLLRYKTFFKEEMKTSLKGNSLFDQLEVKKHFTIAGHFVHRRKGNKANPIIPELFKMFSDY